MQTRSTPSRDLTPLDFLRSEAGLPGLATSTVDLSQVPVQVQGLLGQEDGMTAALERHWGEPMRLRVRQSIRAGNHLLRAVALIGAHRGLPSEAGFIDIHLAALPAGLVAAVESGHRPFGSLLADCGISFRSRPQRFFSVAADTYLADQLQVPVGVRLYGRETRLSTASGRLLAEVVEIVREIPG